ncbi:MAG: hypothetical protein HY713_01250 [candidate division NC10 bacterium]|nr:hypothetical protein [candidate division NC10 bacterium]
MKKKTAVHLGDRAGVEAPRREKLRLAEGLWSTRALPTELADHWRKWIGSLRAGRIEKAELFLVATGPSKAPDILDGENLKLQHRVGHLYWGLLVAASIRTKADPVQERATGLFDPLYPRCTTLVPNGA